MKSTIETKETPQLALAEILYLATMGGAQVCSLQDKVGNFMVGKEFDALLIDPGVKVGMLIFLKKMLRIGIVC